MNRIFYFGIAICLGLAVFSGKAAAQVSADTTAAYITSGNGKVNIRMPESAEAFMAAMKSAEYQPAGFRVQLTGESGQGSQARANDVKARFISNYPNVDAYLVWEAPNFKIRVGDFRTKFEAAMFWKQVQAEFPNSYVVEDKINPGGKRK
jgi:hypothetical protein